LSKEICNEYAAQTMFCQSQAFSAKKSQILSGFLISKKKKPKVFKGSENFQSLASKKQLATRRSNSASSFLLVHILAFYIM